MIDGFVKSLLVALAPLYQQNKFYEVGRVSYPAMNRFHLSGMESRPTFCFIVNVN